jgi:membrane protein YdbS with pleckstrin-like domain
VASGRALQSATVIRGPPHRSSAALEAWKGNSGVTESDISTRQAVAGTAVQLRPPRHRVSRRAIWFWATRAAFGWLLVAAVQVLWWVLADDGAGWSAMALAVTVVLAVAHLAVMPRWRYRVHRWEATPQAMYTQSGWFNQERRIAPISRIQTVDSERGPLEQVFGLANVTVTTASAAGPLRVHGLDRDTAEHLVEDLTSRTQASPGDAT